MKNIRYIKGSTRLLLVCLLLLALLPLTAFARTDIDESFADVGVADVIIDAITGEPVTMEELASTHAEPHFLERLERNMLQGFSPGISPLNATAHITRAEGIALLAQAMLPTQFTGSTSGNFPNAVGRFPDVRVQDWFYPHVALATPPTRNWASGDGGNFVPNRTVSREEFVIMAVRARNLPASNIALPFADTNQISSWALPYIRSAVAGGLVIGGSGSHFFPLQNMQRDHAEVIVSRMNAPGGALSVPSAIRTITWNVNGGTALNPTGTWQRVAGTAIGNQTPSTTRVGHTFDGWWTAASGGSRIVTSTAMPSVNTTYTARWTRNTQVVTFSANGGNWAGVTTNQTRTVNRGIVGDTYAQAFNANDILQNPVQNPPTRPGYVFSGWWSAASGGTRVRNSTTVTAINTRTLHAQWIRELAQHQITMNRSSGRADFTLTGIHYLDLEIRLNERDFPLLNNLHFYIEYDPTRLSPRFVSDAIFGHSVVQVTPNGLNGHISMPVQPVVSQPGHIPVFFETVNMERVPVISANNILATVHFDVIGSGDTTIHLRRSGVWTAE